VAHQARPAVPEPAGPSPALLAGRTVRYALERLEAIDVVSEDVYFADARQNLYQLTDADDQSAETVAAADD
jgi:hypothetical protein